MFPFVLYLLFTLYTAPILKGTEPIWENIDIEMSWFDSRAEYLLARGPMGNKLFSWFKAGPNR